MEGNILTALLTQGALGLLAAAFGYIALRLYRDREADRVAHEKERKEWEARYVTKAESWIEKNHEVISAHGDILEALGRRYEGLAKLIKELRDSQRDRR